MSARREDEIGDSPDELKAVKGVALSDYVLKVDVNMIVDVFLISIENIQSNGTVLSASQRSLLGSFFLLLGLLLLFRLLLV